MTIGENINLNNDYQAELDKAKLKVVTKIIDRNEQLLYHNISFVKRMLDNINVICAQGNYTPEDRAIIYLGFYSLMFVFNNFDKVEGKIDQLKPSYEKTVEDHLPTLLNELDLPQSLKDRILSGIGKMMDMGFEIDPVLGVIQDARMKDFVDGKSKEKMESFYKELLINNVDLSKTQFYDMNMQIFSSYTPSSDYAKEFIADKVNKLLANLDKEKGKIQKNKEFLAKKELDLDNDELKQLTKNLKSVKGRDARGIQTLFRTTSHNHYTLNEMVDRKAHIMITVNSILLSIIIGGQFVQISLPLTGLSLVYAVLAITNGISLIFAVLAITPNKTQGSYSLDEIKQKKGSLLYFGNFYKLDYQDYEDAMMDKINDSEYMYRSLIKDLYFMGQILAKKNKLIRISLGIFLVGLVISFILISLTTCQNLF